MSKHTPGPWEVYHDGYHDVWSVEGGGDTLCALYFLDEETHRRHPIGEPNAEGNARLIAAAPMLLEACKAFFNECDEGESIFGPTTFWQSLGQLRAAIALAEQEPTP